MSSPLCLPDGRRIDDLKVSDLRKELEIRGLSRSGVKKDLCARLSGALDEIKNIDVEQESNELDSQVDIAPSLPKENLEEHVEDTLEIDAVASDEDVADASTNTIIFIPKGDHTTESSGIHENSRLDTENDSSDAVVELEETSQTPEEKIEKNTPETNILPVSTGDTTPTTKCDTQIPNRRRQWGSRSTSTTPSLSSESLQKLIPTPVPLPNIQLKTESDLLELEREVFENIDKPSDQEVEPKVSEEEEHVDNLDRDIELEVDNSVENIDADESVNNDAVLYDSRTVHLSPDSNISVPDKISSSEVLVDETDAKNKEKNSTDEEANSISIRKDAFKNASPVKRKGPKETKAIGYLVEAPERVEPVVPARNPPTDIVYIRFLVRPFTAEQLRQMISSRYGTVVDLWLDRIKSSSLIRMQSVEEATKCREGLDGSRWPSMNPRVLRCEFATDELFAWMKVNGDTNDLQPPKHLLFSDNSSSLLDVDTSTHKNKKSDAENLLSTERDSKTNDLRRKLERVVRNSDPISTERQKHSDIKDITITEPKPKTEEPAKLLNNLFRKTLATPSVYWLPLTDEQAEQQAIRRKEKLVSKSSTRQSSEPKRATRSPFANRPTSPVKKSPNSKSGRSNRGPGVKVNEENQQSQRSSDSTAHLKKSSNGTVIEESRSLSDTKPKTKEITKPSIQEQTSRQDRLSHPEMTQKPSANKSEKISADTKKGKDQLSPSTTHKRKLSRSDSMEKDSAPSKITKIAPSSTNEPSKYVRSISPERKPRPDHSGRSGYRRRSSSSLSNSPDRRRNDRPSDAHSKYRAEASSSSRSGRQRSRSPDRRDRSVSRDRYRSRR